MFDPYKDKETMLNMINFIDEKLSWVNNHIERGGMIGQKRVLEIKLEQLEDKLSKE